MAVSQKQKTVYICGECGCEHPKWNGQCAGCHSWNTLEEVKTRKTAPEGGFLTDGVRPAPVRELGEIDCGDDVRLDAGMGEFNRVLGGGLVKGSLVLLSGEPGIGKSTLLLQLCHTMRGKAALKILYVTGEESERQLKIRAERLGLISGGGGAALSGVYVAQSSDCLGAAAAIEQNAPDLVIVDSIQTMRINAVNSAQGSVAQVRECTNLLMAVAKSKEIPIFIIGHVNKDGGIAGPKVLEHIVDAVLYFEGDRQLSYRILRAVKNRFGSTNEIGVFEMRDKGLREVPNPSAMLLSGRPKGVSGISVLCTMEGTRPILAEVQALVAKSGFAVPRRVSNGFDYNRLCLILAVLEKRAGLFFGGLDVYINVIGGLRADEPAADLAVALALYSGTRDVAVPEDLAVFGEIGLGGEIRSVGNAVERVRECSRMGFSSCVIPKAALKQLDKRENYGIGIIGASNLGQMFNAVEKQEQK
ncbi:MAG: DNA repair protein RadA [Oscillospiraceae bacterium]|jgi:DNA repair protein RadA/Sms|nr:DNA repair protein RadA [Oscillospiraceae bacterium]